MNNDNEFTEKLVAAIHRTAGPKNMRRDRLYNGKDHTEQGIRGSQLVTGLTMRDIYDAMVRGYIMAHPTLDPKTFKPFEPNHSLFREASKSEFAQLNSNDMFEIVGDPDPVAVIQNTMCEIERLMGIFPNIPNRITGEKDELTRASQCSFVSESGLTVEMVSLEGIEPSHEEVVWVLKKNNVQQDSDPILNALVDRNNLVLTNEN